MLRFLVASALLLLAMTQSSADCVVTNQTATNPYAEFDLTNSCHGGAKVHWTRRGDKGATEQGSFFVGGCKTTHHQYFPGEYTFTSIEFPRGGEAELCLKPGDSAKRSDPPNQGPSSDLAKRSAAQQKANADAASKVTEQEQTFKKRYEDAKIQEQNKRQHVEKEQRDAAARQVEKERDEKLASEAQAIRQAAKERDQERTERDALAAKSQLCFGSGIESSSMTYACNRICNVIAYRSHTDPDECFNNCKTQRQSAAGRCVPIDPSIRAAVLGQLREKFDGYYKYGLPDK